MKKIAALLIFTFLSTAMNAQSLIGAWERYHTAENGEKLKTVAIFSDGYYAFATYNAANGKFKHTNGGAWKVEANTLTENVEFNTAQPELVGKEIKSRMSITNTVFKIASTQEEFKRIDDGKPGKLQGAWLMAGRVTDGKEQLRDTNTPRKTMKIMSGTCFQWIAYNTDTKQFMGTGGGTYTTADQKYTENIVFFSKDDTRVGASLKFDYNLMGKKWYHSGFSSKGDPLHEVWTKRE